MYFSASDRTANDERLRRSVFAAYVAICVFFIVVTGITRADVASGPVERGLYLLTLAVENNVGAWWSGMLLLLLSLLAYDGYAFNAVRAPRAAQAWAIVAGILLFFSFDEISSLHERLSGLANTFGLSGWAFVLPLGAVLGVCFLRAVYLLWTEGENHVLVACLVLGFGLLGSVVAQEFVEHLFAWDNRWLDAVRVAFEEGTELAGMLVLLWALLRNAAPFSNRGAAEGRPTFAALADLWRPLLVLVVAVAPIAAVITVAAASADGRGRPADWVATSLFALAALGAVRPALKAGAFPRLADAAVAGLCLLASVAVMILPITSQRSILGAEFGTRLLVLGAVCVALGLVRIVQTARLRPLEVARYGLLAEAAALAPFLSGAPWTLYLLTQLLALATFGLEARRTAAAPAATRLDEGRHPLAADEGRGAALAL